MELGAAPEDTLALRTRRQQLFALHFDDVTRFTHSPFSLTHTTFELGSRHLRVRQFLSSGLQFGAHLRETTLGIAHLSSERIHGQLEIDNLRLHDRLQFAAGCGAQGNQADRAERHRSSRNAPPEDSAAIVSTGIWNHHYHRLYGVPLVPTNSEPEKTSNIPPSVASLISCHDVAEFVNGSLGIARK